MIRIPPEDNEVELYVTYFWDRLAPSQEPHTPDVTREIDLRKKPAYFARRQLLRVKTGAELAAWAEQWIDAEDWRRGRDSVRAWRYKARNKLVRPSMREDTKRLLDERAQALNIPLWRYLHCLDLSPEKLQQLEHQAGLILDGDP